MTQDLAFVFQKVFKALPFHILVFGRVKVEEPKCTKEIRNCNLFLEEILTVQDIQEFEREQWIGEVKMLKAYYHFYLARNVWPNHY